MILLVWLDFWSNQIDDKLERNVMGIDDLL